jgi:predicted transcriptional regulator
MKDLVNFFKDEVRKTKENPLDFDLTVLRAVCIEKPNATFKSIRHRVDFLRGEETSVGVLSFALERLEEIGFISHEKINYGKNQVFYFYPTDKGKIKNNDYESLCYKNLNQIDFALR